MDSDRDSDTEGAAGGKRVKGDPSVPPQTATDAIQMISSALADTSIDNVSRVKGLLYFAGVEEVDRKKHTDKKLESSPREWLKALENKTKKQFTDTGKLCVAKMYALGAVKEWVDYCEYKVRKVSSKNEFIWRDFKDIFLEIYPKDRTAANLSRKLREMRKDENGEESYSSFYTRVCTLHWACTKEGFGGVMLEDSLADIMRRNLPKLYVNNVTDPDVLGDYKALYEGWLSQSQIHPMFLDQSGGTKKIGPSYSQSANVLSVNEKTNGNGSKPKVINSNQRSYQQYQQPRGNQGRPIQCERCNRSGHEAKVCRTPCDRIPNFRVDGNRGSRVLCQRCRMSGHMAYGCMTEWERAKERQDDFDQRRCYRCHCSGHQTSECGQAPQSLSVRPKMRNEGTSRPIVTVTHGNGEAEVDKKKKTPI